ncbi:hypothetical protein ABR39_00920 [Enterobacter genomosp. O]|uniref:hypothetical protein n=1 Tax=Enterobacter genomosp. O TaxID=2364150 RepID=UPI0006438CB4|nr:hypothetical protein [Enterobacter genomosp. O]KLP59590.1 hypothetical protein ABR39_00920 [Enterobacter genomosp. O]
MKHITLAVLPLILSACSSSQPDQRIDITHGKPTSVQKVVSLRMDAPLSQPVTFDNSDSVRYVNSVTTEDGKIVSKEYRTLSYGTTVRAVVSDAGDDKQLVSLAVRHACHPELTKLPAGSAEEGIDLPSQNYITQQQKILIARGDDVLISGSGFDVNCAFPRITVHPTE